MSFPAYSLELYPAFVWFTFGLVCFGIYHTYQQKKVAKEFAISTEIALIVSGLLYLTGNFPWLIFITVVATITGIVGLKYLGLSLEVQGDLNDIKDNPKHIKDIRVDLKKTT